MAKVVLPALSGQASGKVGDIVFLTRYGQTIARIRKKPANPKTPKQQTVRGNLSALSQAWKGSGSLVRTGNNNRKYVEVKKYNPQTQMWEVVEFDVLTTEEKQAWENKAMQTKGYKQYGRLMFIGQNAERLSDGLNPTRMP